MSGAPANALVTKIKATYEIKHTYIGDLVVWLTAYFDGSWHDYNLHNRTGGDTDNITQTVDNIHVWDGAVVNQQWFLRAQDCSTGETGFIDTFEIWINWETL